MWFAGTNMFYTLFVFDMKNPVFLPHDQYINLLNKDIISEILDTGHVKLITQSGDKILSIHSPKYPAGPKTTTLRGFICDSKEKAIQKLNDES